MNSLSTIMKNIVRKLLSILVLFIAWYFLSMGMASLLGTFSMLASIKNSISLWNVKWFTVITDPILIIGLLLMIIGTALWSLQQWRLIIGILILIETVDSVARAWSVIYVPAPPSEFFNASIFFVGYIFFGVLSLLLGVYLIKNYNDAKKVRHKAQEEH
jgi:hypothetical protein